MFFGKTPILLPLGLLLGPLWMLTSLPGVASASGAPLAPSAAAAASLLPGVAPPAQASPGSTAPPAAPRPPTDPGTPTQGDPAAPEPARPGPYGPDSRAPGAAPSVPAPPADPDDPPESDPTPRGGHGQPEGTQEEPEGSVHPAGARGPSAYPGLHGGLRARGTRVEQRSEVAPPPPRVWRLRVIARSFSLLVRSSSLDALQSEDLVQSGEISVGAELRIWRDLVLGAELGYAGGRSSGAVLESFRTSLRHDVALVGITLGWRLWDALMPYVRGGLAVTRLDGRVRANDLSLGGRDLAAGGYLLAGLELGVPRSWLRTSSVSVALHLEAGWAKLGRFHLEGGIDESRLVDEYRAGLGRITLSGAAVNVGLSLSF